MMNRDTMKIFRLSLFLLLLTAFGCETTHRTTGPDISIERKYSKILETNKENIINLKLYTFIDEWYGTPYKYGGKSKKGADCSGFTSVLYKEVYGKEVSGSSASIFTQCKPLSKKELQEGDLVFFRIDSKTISHVGVYLQNNKFVHATTKAGVMINDLNEEYYKKYFGGAGRTN